MPLYCGVSKWLKSVFPFVYFQSQECEDSPRTARKLQFMVTSDGLETTSGAMDTVPCRGDRSPPSKRLRPSPLPAVDDDSLVNSMCWSMRYSPPMSPLASPDEGFESQVDSPDSIVMSPGLDDQLNRLSSQLANTFVFPATPVSSC